MKMHFVTAGRKSLFLQEEISNRGSNLKQPVWDWGKEEKIKEGREEKE